MGLRIYTGDLHDRAFTYLSFNTLSIRQE
jgi:hypothetical protein